jgi:rare lipoprotein A
VVETPKPDAFQTRLLKYARLALRHKLTGLASYYSASLDGTLTANGERYRAKRLTAAHLTLPLGCWVEVKSRATGRSIRLRVNDRGPYVSKFVIDLSEAAARALGVDRAEDRRVDIRIIALPGEDPLPEDALLAANTPKSGGGGGTAVADAKPTAAITTEEK